MSAIRVQNLNKRYGERLVVQDVSFTVEKGEIFGLVGPNGAGKTTLVECIAGLRQPDAGQVWVNDLDPRQERDTLRKILGIQLQASLLPDKIKVWEALDLYSAFYDAPVDWQQILVSLGLVEHRNMPFEKLSGGQKQRLSIGLALVGNPQILILDELTTGLDPEARRSIWRYILDLRDQGVTILLVSHFMEEAERLCDRLAVLNAGCIVALDTPAAIIARAGGQQRVRFRPSIPLSDHLFSDLPEVQQVIQENMGQVTISGTGNLVHTVTSVLARNGIIAHDMRFEQASLEDAFLALAHKGH